MFGKYIEAIDGFILTYILNCPIGSLAKLKVTAKLKVPGKY